MFGPIPYHPRSKSQVPRRTAAAPQAPKAPQAKSGPLFPNPAPVPTRKFTLTPPADNPPSYHPYAYVPLPFDSEAKQAEERAVPESVRASAQVEKDRTRCGLVFNGRSVPMAERVQYHAYCSGTSADRPASAAADPLLADAYLFTSQAIFVPPQLAPGQNPPMSLIEAYGKPTLALTDALAAGGGVLDKSPSANCEYRITRDPTGGRPTLEGRIIQNLFRLANGHIIFTYEVIIHDILGTFEDGLSFRHYDKEFIEVESTAEFEAFKDAHFISKLEDRIEKHAAAAAEDAGGAGVDVAAVETTQPPPLVDAPALALIAPPPPPPPQPAEDVASTGTTMPPPAPPVDSARSSLATTTPKITLRSASRSAGSPDGARLQSGEFVTQKDDALRRLQILLAPHLEECAGNEEETRALLSDLFDGTLTVRPGSKLTPDMKALVLFINTNTNSFSATHTTERARKMVVKLFEIQEARLIAYGVTSFDAWLEIYFVTTPDDRAAMSRLHTKTHQRR